MTRTIRVFPRRTKATPDDNLVVINRRPGFDFIDYADEVHISITFSWDLERGNHLAKQWERVAPVSFGGPATGMPGNAFTPGMYLKNGYVITSRGCPNKCWFCDVWKREGPIKELPIADGWNILDDNLLSCSKKHIKDVFSMLHRMKKERHQIEFTGGLEAAKLEHWHCEELRKLRPQQMFFAYDTEDDLEPLQQAGKLLEDVGWSLTSWNQLRSFVLCGYPKDTFSGAKKRMWETVDAGFMPMAMLYRGKDGLPSKEWKRFQREWARPAIIRKKIKTRS